MKILGIETSCDETAAAVVENGRRIMSNVVASQIPLHRRYGGVVPEVASRQHVRTIVTVVEEALNTAGVTWKDLDGVAVTRGPGLAGSLLVGLSMAKTVALAWNLPLVGINHLEGHVYANWLGDKTPEFPLVCLIVSGGHSDLVFMPQHLRYTLLGCTRDDAAGEAFDKAARILGLGYPGGPAIEEAARRGHPGRIKLPRARLGDSWDFSFSGLKTALVRLVEKDPHLDPADVALAFQEAVIDVLVGKTLEAAKAMRVKQILLAGGVAANRALKNRLVSLSPFPVLVPEPELCTDNAAMVAVAGHYELRQGRRDGLDLDIDPGLGLGAVTPQAS